MSQSDTHKPNESSATNANVAETCVKHLNGIRLEASNEGVGEKGKKALKQSGHKPSPTNPRLQTGTGNGQARHDRQQPIKTQPQGADHFCFGGGATSRLQAIGRRIGFGVRPEIGKRYNFKLIP